MNPILNHAALKAIPTNWTCGKCRRKTKTLYLKTETKQIGKWKYNVIMKGVCKECINNKKVHAGKRLPSTTN